MKIEKEERKVGKGKEEGREKRTQHEEKNEVGRRKEGKKEKE